MAADHVFDTETEGVDVRCDLSEVTETGKLFCSLNGHKSNKLQFLQNRVGSCSVMEETEVENSCSQRGKLIACNASSAAVATRQIIHLDTCKKQCRQSTLKIGFEKESDLNEICQQSEGSLGDGNFLSD